MRINDWVNLRLTGPPSTVIGGFLELDWYCRTLRDSEVKAALGFMLVFGVLSDNSFAGHKLSVEGFARNPVGLIRLSVPYDPRKSGQGGSRYAT